MDTDKPFETTPLDSLLASTETLRAEVFVRSLAPVSRKQTQDELVGRLEGLVESGVLADVDLLVWGDSICTQSPLSEVGSGQRIVDTISEFYALSAEGPLSVAPFFHTADVSAELTGECFRRIVPPHQCIALYDESELVAVVPSVIDEVTYTPRDALSVLEHRQEGSSTVPMADESA